MIKRHKPFVAVLISLLVLSACFLSIPFVSAAAAAQERYSNAKYVDRGYSIYACADAITDDHYQVKVFLQLAPFFTANDDIVQYTLVVNEKDTYVIPSFDDAQGTQTAFVSTIMIADEITSMRVIPVMSKGGENLEESLLLPSSTGDWDAMIHTMAKVRNPKPTERLNLRSAPDIQSEVWMQYYNGTPMEVKNVLPDGWIAVSVGISEGHARGYVKADYLAFGEEAEQVAPQMPARRSTHPFDVHSSPDPSASVISTFPSGTDFTIMGLSKTWWHVRVGDLTGYVSIGTTEGNGAPLATTAPVNEPTIPSNEEFLRQPTATGTVDNNVNEMFFAPTAITTIVSATLEYKPQDNWEGESSIAHTADPQALAILTGWLKDAETLAYIPGCFHSAYENRLTLTLADGTILSALLALDGCAILCGGDVYYSFEPAPYRGTGEHPGNKILYTLFGVERE